MKKIPVGILGATGTVGQRFIQLLADHPWFEITALTGSSRTAGGRYSDGVNWKLHGDVPDQFADMIVQPTEPNLDVEIVFSALPTAQARELEPAFADAGYVVATNASAFRMPLDIPLMIPEVNPDHVELIKTQQEARGWKGYIIANTNCSVATVMLPLKIWDDAFGLTSAHMVTMQAVSGAGYPGVPSLDILGNVVPHIGKEDWKLENEPKKLLGKVENGKLQIADIKLSAHANRVAVIDGHMASVSCGFANSASEADAIAAFKEWQIPEEIQALPSCPDRLMVYRDEPDRPQPRLDSHWGAGLAWTVGKVRECNVLDMKFVSLAHNTLRGAASGSVLNAELLVQRGIISR